MCVVILSGQRGGSSLVLLHLTVSLIHALTYIDTYLHKSVDLFIYVRYDSKGRTDRSVRQQYSNQLGVQGGGRMPPQMLYPGIIQRLFTKSPYDTPIIIQCSWLIVRTACTQGSIQEACWGGKTGVEGKIRRRGRKRNERENLGGGTWKEQMMKKEKEEADGLCGGIPK